MPHFLHTTTTVYSEDETPNLSHAALRTRIAAGAQEKRSLNNETPLCYASTRQLQSTCFPVH